MQYNFTCDCKICKAHVKSLLKNEPKKCLKLVKKDAEAFKKFIKNDLDQDGKVRLVNQAELDMEEQRIEQEIKEGKIDYLRDIKKNKKDLIKPQERFVFVNRENSWLI